MSQTLPDWLSSLYPFTPKAVDIGGQRMSYIDEGEGRAVVMLHGNPTWSFYYRNVIARLSKHRRCIVPDHIGCGLSDKPQTYNYTLDQHIHNAKELLQQLGITQYDLIVHDWGGAIGMGLAVGQPEGVGRIQILNTAAFNGPLPKRIGICKLPLVGEPIVRAFNAFALPATWMASAKGLPTDVKRGYLYPYQNWHDRIATARFVKDIPLSPKHPTFARLQQIANGLNQLKDKPMHILWGRKDFCFNDTFLTEWQRRFPNAKTHVYEDAGHYVLEDAGADILERIAGFME